MADGDLLTLPNGPLLGLFARLQTAAIRRPLLRQVTRLSVLAELGHSQVVGQLIVAAFRAGKSTVRGAYSEDGDNCSMQLRRRVQSH
jgi:hypothetical protein